MQPSRALLYAVSAIALAACSQGTGTQLSSYVPQSASSSQHLDNQFNGSDIALESGNKLVPVVVGGNTLGGSRMALTQNAIQDIQHGNWGSSLAFAPASGRDLASAQGRDQSADVSPYSVVMMVDGPANITAANLCADPTLADAASAMGGSSGPSTVRLTSALCRYNKLISQSSGVAANVSGANDPAFHNLVASAAVDLTGPSSTSIQHNEAL